MADTQAKIYNAPEPIPSELILSPSIFLSGSIVDNWRNEIICQLKHLPITIFNPMRHEWDSTWVQRKIDPKFDEQVRWELDAQERADVVAVYLHPGTPSPISHLELGLAIGRRMDRMDRVVVCCPDGFESKGNVEIVCDRYDVPLVGTFEEFVDRVIERVRS